MNEQPVYAARSKNCILNAYQKQILLKNKCEILTSNKLFIRKKRCFCSIKKEEDLEEFKKVQSLVNDERSQEKIGKQKY